jgi:hypothetical protein
MNINCMGRPLAGHLDIEDLLVEINTGLFRPAGKDHIVHQHFAILFAELNADAGQFFFAGGFIADFEHQRLW